MKQVIIKEKNGVYKIPITLKALKSKKKYFFEYKGKLYDKEIDYGNNNVRQVSLLVNALNIKNKKERLSFMYDRACDLLDVDFYKKNVCEFKCGKCITDRLNNNLGGGCCCDSKDHKGM